MIRTLGDFISILLLGTIGLICTVLPGYAIYNLLALFPVHPYTLWIGAYIFSATALGWFSIYVYAYITAYNIDDNHDMH